MLTKQWLITIFLILCVNTQSFAQNKQDDEPLPDVIILTSYKVINTVKKEVSHQSIKVSFFSEPDSYYKLERKDPETKKILSTEIETEWNKVMFGTNDNYYADQSITFNSGEDKNSFFGRIEIKSFKDHTVVSAWPLVGTITYNKETYSTLTTAFIPNKGKLIILEVFKNNERILPLVRKQQLLDEKGEILSEIYYTRM